MTHLTLLQLSMAADGALNSSEKPELQSHLSTCIACQLQLEQMANESLLIKTFVKSDEAVAVPVFDTPLGLREISVFTVLAGLSAWLSLTLWQIILGGMFTTVLSWLASIHISDGIGLTVSTIFYFSEEGMTMIDTLLGFVIFGLLVIGIVGTLLSKREFRGAVSLCLMVLVFSGLFSSPEASALEYRDDSMVAIGSNETIDDTLIIFGDTAVVDGVINGDLVVFGRRVVVNGTVNGNLIVFTQSVTIAGRIEGSVMGFANMLEMESADIGSNLWGFAQTLRMNSNSRITGNATTFTSSASIAGEVGRDWSAFGDRLELSGEVGEDVEAFSQHINLIGDAYVGGDIRFRSMNEDALRQSPSSVVMGMVEFMPTFEGVRRNKYLTLGYYLGQTARLLTAFLAGMALLWFFPALRTVSIANGFAGVKTAGVGFLALICTPVVMLLCLVTIVGIPFSVIGLFVWVLGLYFSKIVVASIIGRLLLTSADKQNNYVLSLLVGLAVVVLVINIPVVGGLLSFIMMLLGLGILVQKVFGYSDGLNSKNT